MNTPSSIALTPKALPICARCRTGICAINWKPCPVSPRLPASADSSRQYQVNLDPNKLFSYGIPPQLSSIVFAKAPTKSAAIVLEMSGAEYMIRGVGYLRSLSDLENVPVATKNGTPVLVRDLGTVSFGPDVRRGAADWQGEGRDGRRHRGDALRNERARTSSMA